ncbi:MAG: hypothetical protein Q9P90_14625 [candidate division KSB1 bacterium]|nr:hypothetical protein [candidate division KSB1 bacterium]
MMFAKRFALIAAMVFIFAGLSHAQNSRWSLALKSSYFGDQSRNAHQLTAINKPISLGFQLQFYLRPDLALRYSAESLSGKTQTPPGNELNVQSSVAFVAYPIEFWMLRPYLIQGLLWKRHNNSSGTASNGNVYYEIGFGTEFVLSRKLFSSLAAKMYTDGRIYHGWSTSLSFGYRL